MHFIMLRTATIMMYVLLMVTAPSFARNKEDSACNMAKKLARQDVAAGVPHYYFFGILPPDANSLSVLTQKYKLKGIVMGCMVQPDKLCYNQEIDKYVTQKYGKTVMALIEEFKQK